MSSPTGGPGPRRSAARPHTGRRRNAAAREAILDATFDLLRAQGAGGVTIDAIAEAAGVGRQTIYRWWPTKGAVVAEAMTRGAQAIASPRATGSFREDLRCFLADSFAGLQDPGTRRALRQLASAAVHDEHASGVLAEFTAQRRAALRALLERGVASGDIAVTADLGMLVDLAYGVLWYRLLVGHASLDAGAARDLATHLIAAGQAATARSRGDVAPRLGSRRHAVDVRARNRHRRADDRAAPGRGRGRAHRRQDRARQPPPSARGPRRAGTLAA
jgi:AcrR family transcriptional regulator